MKTVTVKTTCGRTLNVVVDHSDHDVLCYVDHDEQIEGETDGISIADDKSTLTREEHAQAHVRWLGYEVE